MAPAVVDHVDQHDRVVDHDAGQCEQAEQRLETERDLQQQQPGDHPDQRERRGEQHQSHADERVELHEQKEQQQRDAQRRRGEQRGIGLAGLLGIAAILDLRAGRQRQFGDPRLQGREHLAVDMAFDEFAVHVGHPALIVVTNGARLDRQARDRHLHERHRAALGVVDAGGLQRGGREVFALRAAQLDRHRVFTGAVLANDQPMTASTQRFGDIHRGDPEAARNRRLDRVVEARHAGAQIVTHVARTRDAEGRVEDRFRGFDQTLRIVVENAQFDRRGDRRALAEHRGDHVGRRQVIGAVALDRADDRVVALQSVGLDHQPGALRRLGQLLEVVVELRPPCTDEAVHGLYARHPVQRLFEFARGLLRSGQVGAFRQGDIHDHGGAIGFRKEFLIHETHAAQRDRDRRHAQRKPRRRVASGHMRQPVRQTLDGITSGARLGAQETLADQRRHGHRVEIADAEREHDRDRQRTDEVRRIAVGEQHRHERRQRGAGCRQQRAGEFTHRPHRGIVRFGAAIEMPLHVLGHHDRVVDQDAQGDHQADDRHLLQYAAAQCIKSDRGERDQWQQHRDDDAHAPAHEHEQNAENDRDRRQQIEREIGQALLGLCRLVEHLLDLQRREFGAHLLCGCPYTTAERDHVGGFAYRDHFHRYRTFALEPHALAWRLGAGLVDMGDRRQRHGTAARQTDCRRPDVVDRVVIGVRLQIDGCAGEQNRAARGHAVVCTDIVGDPLRG